MDIFDLKTGSLYAILAIASCVYLLWGFDLRLRPLLKAIMAIQVMGDLLFFNLIVRYDIFSFIKSLTAEDRIYPLLVLMACVISMDVGAALVGRKKRPGGKRLPDRARPDSASAPVKIERRATPLNLDPAAARKVGVTLVVLAVIFKALEVISSGALSGSFWVSNILGWQPEMSMGYTFLNVLDVSLLPIGAALLVTFSKRRPHWIALCSFPVFGFLSPWKGEIIHLTILYTFTIYQFGWQEIRRMIRAKTTVAAVIAVLIILPIKGQLRSGVTRVQLDEDSLVASFVGSAAARAMGGVFQTYTYVMNGLQRGYPMMGGRYNLQVLYLWVPRLLWHDKPDTASEDLYYYLMSSRSPDEPYGTAFAITTFGTFNLDFGFWWSLVCSLIFGALLALGERVLVKLKDARNSVTRVISVALAVAWLNAVFPLSEGGLPSAFTSLLIVVSALTASWFVLANPWGASKTTVPEKSVMGRGPWARRIVRGV